ncbi:DUF1882 domain-containing protein [Providencia rettgeri]|uniref:DUF1882 domain-containing protein n=1 Tax=Providencia rettgeri TaxID=587 RepID=A0AAE2ZEB0_PRORE|nr:DUF1882 domain-containing protein [Providencia rettgeri]MRF67181.1 DUF1882 domain-containing protein [Escherichia coli]QIF64873.1 DUF1882 domain-containing protein [Providencia sp. 1709051003]THB26589.1 DUF1882 domain-containing protein [Providencia sp. MGF014]EHZ6874449.1 DUF1882 domain-containing protein [Providencia rettgeri]
MLRISFLGRHLFNKWEKISKLLNKIKVFLLLTN